MTVQYKLTTPAEAQATLTFHGTVADFNHLLDIINTHESPDRWPMGELRRALQKVIWDASRHFNQEVAKDATSKN